MKPIFYVLCVIAGVIAGVFIDRLALQWEPGQMDDMHKIVAAHDTYKLVNPIIGFDSGESREAPYVEMENDMRRYIADAKQQGIATDVSVYFRNISSGRGQWIGIGEGEKYNPASLFKVPILISYLKRAQDDPAVLAEELTYTDALYNEIASVPGADLTTTLERNGSYSVDELIRAMIIRSDNIAKQMLLEHSPIDPFTDILGDLGITIDPQKDWISVKTYSLIFRTLYNATVLDRSTSEKALELLTEVDYPDGLRAGLPSSVLVAQKYGVYAGGAVGGTDGKNEVHDCGIVYYTVETPYILCVMTRGSSSPKELETVIKGISKITYDFVDTHPEMLKPGS